MFIYNYYITMIKTPWYDRKSPDLVQVHAFHHLLIRIIILSLNY